MESRTDVVRVERREASGEVRPLRPNGRGLRPARPVRVRGAFVSGDRAIAGAPGPRVRVLRPLDGPSVVPGCRPRPAEQAPERAQRAPGHASRAPERAQRALGRGEWVPGHAEQVGAPPGACGAGAAPTRHRPHRVLADPPCVPERRPRHERPGGARRLAGEARLGLVDRLLVGAAVVLGSAAAVVVLGLLADLAAR